MNESFGQRLKRLRELRRLSAAEMARQIGTAATTYREWEYGQKNSLPPLLKISQVLAVSVTELLTGENSMLTELSELEALEKKLREIRLKLTAMMNERKTDF